MERAQELCALSPYLVLSISSSGWWFICFIKSLIKVVSISVYLSSVSHYNKFKEPKEEVLTSDVASWSEAQVTASGP